MATTNQGPVQVDEQALALTRTSPLVVDLANSWKINPSTMIDTLKSTVFPQKDRAQNPIVVTNAQLIMFMQVCHEYKLNPFIKEIYAFPTKGGGIVPMVPIDGWANIVNRHPQMDGVEFIDVWEGTGDTRNLFSTTAVIYRKDWTRPTKITEYMKECYDGTKDPWKKWPARMLRHKAFIQCARIAFSLAGIYDPDEAERIAESGEVPKQSVQRPARVIEGTAVETKAAPAQTAAAQTAPVQEQPKQEPTKVVEQQPATQTKTCFCTCCKKGECDCPTKEEFDRCGCDPCKEKVAAVSAPAPTEDAPTASPSGEEVFGKTAVQGEVVPEPEGPYVTGQKIKRMFAIARGAGVQIVDDSTDDQLHKILNTFGILSAKKIPEKMYEDVCKAVGGDKLAIK